MPAAVQIAPDDLSNLLSVLIFLAPTKKPPNGGIFVSGACGRIRTSDRLVRSQVLYPAELRTRSTLITVIRVSFDVEAHSTETVV